MATLPHVHGGNLRAAAEQYGIAISDLIDFSANINPLGPSTKALEAIRNSLDRVAHYPDPDCLELRRALSEYIRLPLENIIMGNGAVELIFILMHVLKPQAVLIPAPTFGEYEAAAISAGCQIKSLPLNREENFLLNVDQVVNTLKNVDAVFICNPNNPTGQLTGRAELEYIIREARKKNVWVIVDEAFIDFLAEKTLYSVMDLVKRYENLFILYSLTKFHALPGLRLGAGLGNRSLVSKMMSHKDPWNVNVLAQIAGVASLKDEKYMQDTVNMVQKEKLYLYEQLKKIAGLHPYPPSANYVFVDVSKTGRTSTEITEMMGKKGILVRDCSSYKNLGCGYIRVAVRKRDDNNMLLQALPETVNL
ncbi:threonine-phosphate decarboxylase CobD [Thermincola potens]|uniref:threonine-phosphate decarboxylase n=1 Tax=Thermincola potens (strain JR) TaxID=635013 RepID=D5XEV1_THEPJ|nr:threonine-phosphate decarboxylase CobD [Thermincola potens]ADG82172.1 L-threonine-O-3-phosphate decarboxylase [Thermincola potens JR]